MTIKFLHSFHNSGWNILHRSGVMEHHTSRSLCKLLAQTAVGQDERDSDHPERLPQGHLTSASCADAWTLLITLVVHQANLIFQLKSQLCELVNLSGGAIQYAFWNWPILFSFFLLCYFLSRLLICWLSWYQIQHCMAHLFSFVNHKTRDIFGSNVGFPDENKYNGLHWKYGTSWQVIQKMRISNQTHILSSF